jgi:mercuric reductase
MNQTKIPPRVFLAYAAEWAIMKLDFEVSGMTCLDCTRHITRALERVEGVKSASVDYRGGRASVELAHEVPAEDLVAAVERAGYRAELPGAPTTRQAEMVAHQAAPVRTARGEAQREGTGTPSFAGEEPVRVSRADPSLPGNGRSGGAADFDILIIGTGGAGVAAAIQAVGMGGKVGIAESGTLGGTCVNVGCIPSKNLIEAAAHYHAARKGFPGIAPCEPQLDWKAVLRQKNELVAELRQAKYADVLASYPGVAVLGGRAELVAANDNGADSPVRVRVGDTEHSARKVVIAVGTSSSLPPIPGLADVDPLDSTTAMELDELPTSLIVLGGSAVGLELGQTFARFGVRVTVVELMPRLLQNEDEAVSEALRHYLESEGIEVHTGMTTTRVEHAGNEIIVHVRHGSLEGQLRAQRLLVATGRRPNTSDLGLERVGIRLTEKGFVQVDATMRTSNANVYAAGDVTGGPGYVYVAAAGGRVAAENAMKSLSPAGVGSEDPREFDLSVVPNVTFTSPQVGSVGLTEARARDQGIHIQVSRLEMEQVPRALVSHDKRGFVKIVSEAASGKILGVHAVAPNAGEFMGEAALAVRFGLTARDLSGTLHPYLTWIESLKLAAQGFSMDISKLSCCA